MFDPAVFGKRVRELRTAKGLSQQRLATLCKVSRPCVYQWEAGTVAPRIQHAQKLAEVLDVELSYLVGES